LILEFAAGVVGTGAPVTADQKLRRVKRGSVMRSVLDGRGIVLLKEAQKMGALRAKAKVRGAVRALGFE